MSVVARMRVNYTDPQPYGTQVKMAPVYASDGNDPPEVVEEIRSFVEATPSGAFEMVITNPSAAEQFQVGDQFYVHLERIPKP